MTAARLMLYAKCLESVFNIEKVCQSVLKLWESMVQVTMGAIKTLWTTEQANK
jgi:hypothetical protein